ncbi:MAG: phosphatidylglycerophosphatase A [Oligoflexales bacterium]
MQLSQPPRPKASTFSFYEWASVVGGFGLMPIAPGTWGSLPGVLLGAALSKYSTSTALTVSCLVVLGLLSAWVIAKTEAIWNRHDDKAIVIDEVVGQAICLSFVNPTITNLIIGFFLFRLFDILKPEPVGFFDRWEHSLGTLLDDVFAGIMAGICLLAFQLFL